MEITNKEKFIQLFKANRPKGLVISMPESGWEYMYNIATQFAKEVHTNACEEQKKICADKATLHISDESGDYFGDTIFYAKDSTEGKCEVHKDSILNSPNAKFE